MNKIITFKKILLSLTFVAVAWLFQPMQSMAQTRSNSSQSVNIDFDVRPSGNRHIRLSFYNTSDALVQIRIYDVIGNLVKKDMVSTKGKYVKEYDMSHNKSEVFVVEVGNTKYSNTKRVYIQ